MKTLLSTCLLIILINTSTLAGQPIKYQTIKVSTNFDSLKKAMNNQTGESKLQTLLSLQKSYLYWFINDDTYLKMLEKYINNNRYAANAHIYCFKAHYEAVSTKNYPKGIYFANKALNEYIKQKDTSGIITANTILGIMNFESNPNLSQKYTNYLNKAYSFSKTINDKEVKLLGQFAYLRLLTANIYLNADVIIKRADSVITVINKTNEYEHFNLLFYDRLSLAYAVKKKYLLSLSVDKKILSLFKKHSIPIPVAALTKNFNYDFLKIREEINNQLIKFEENEKQMLQQEKDLAIEKKQLYFIYVALALGGLFITLLLTYIFYKKNIELKSANERIVRLNKLKQYFIGIVIHDLRQPLSSIIGIYDTVKYYIDNKDYNKVESIIYNLDESSYKLHGMFENLLKWASSQNEEVPYVPQTINLYTCIQETIDIYKHILERKQVKITVQCSENCTLFADYNGILLILRNLVGNALKAVEAKTGKIVIEVREIINGTVIEISDNGHGIDEVKLGIINTAIATPDKVQPGEQGIGLGILLTSRFVKRNKGNIEVKNVPNEGTSFTISFLE